MTSLSFVYDDGGRAAAGFKGNADDCVTRAVSIATGKSYAEVYAELNAAGRAERLRKQRARSKGVNTGRSSARTGIYKETTRRYLQSLGWTWHPTMQKAQRSTCEPASYRQAG